MALLWPDLGAATEIDANQRRRYQLGNAKS